jgi:TatD DNase family protein
VIDTHCHLDHKQFAADRDQVIERARAAGVQGFIAIGTGDGPPDLLSGIRLANQFDFFHATAGVHPHDASRATAETIEDLATAAGHPKVVAIGEIGLDYHYDFSPRAVQQELFRAQLRLARSLELPVVIHTREAWADTVAILREEGASAGVFHCFTSGPEEAAEALDLGFHLGIGGVLTFPRSEGLREAVRLAPSDRLLLETDAPYLAPVPHRGKRNEPAYVAETARKVAEVRGEPVESVARTTTANVARLFVRYTG